MNKQVLMKIKNAFIYLFFYCQIKNYLQSARRTISKSYCRRVATEVHQHHFCGNLYTNICIQYVTLLSNLKPKVQVFVVYDYAHCPVNLLLRHQDEIAQFSNASGTIFDYLSLFAKIEVQECFYKIYILRRFYLK